MPNEELARAKEAEYAAQLNDLKYQIDEAKKVNPDFYEKGVKILELMLLLYSQYVAGNLEVKARILKTIASNYSLNGVTICPAYRKPFSFFAEGLSRPQWLPRMDSNHEYLIQSQVCYHYTTGQSTSNPEKIARSWLPQSF